MTRCDRAWQAEALEDGRLGAEHEASFERHLASCAECRAERRAIVELRRKAREMPVPQTPALVQLRQRERLLARANRKMIAPVRPSRLAALLVAIAALCVVIAVRHRGRAKVASTAIAAPTYRVVDVASADWHVVDSSPSTRVALHAGTARFEVDHLRAGQRFVVVLPDGEIEVRGTGFVVRVAGSTEEVSVDSGIVALRIGGSETLLSAGMRWSRPLPPVTSTSSPASAMPTPVLATVASSVIATAPLLATAKAAPSTKEPVASGSDFGAAMKSFASADYAAADTAFADFATRHPGDARVEDALFLRAVCASRLGNNEGARARAREYLARYPQGFRVADARRLAE